MHGTTSVDHLVKLDCKWFVNKNNDLPLLLIKRQAKCSPTDSTLLEKKGFIGVLHMRHRVLYSTPKNPLS